MSKKKLFVFLSFIISAVFCFQVIASSSTYQEEQWRKQGIDFHRIESEDAMEIINEYQYKDDKGTLHSVMVAKDGTEYDNTSTLISSHVEYTDENDSVIEVVDYVNPDYTDHTNAKKIIAEKSNYENNETIAYCFYDNYTAYKNPVSRSNTNKTETKDTPKVRISISDYVPIHNIEDIENIAGYVIKAKALEGKENTSFGEYGGGYTKINLEVTDVYKGDLNIGDVIPLMERYYIEDDGTELRRDGYSASEVGKEYLFFVGKYDDGLYDTVCTVLGRYSLEDTQALNGEVDTIETNIVEEYKPLYYQLKEEVINKYK